MGDPGPFWFPGNLDPRGQEFVPAINSIHNNPTRIPFPTPNQVYYPYTSLPLLPPLYPLNEYQVVPFFNFPLPPAHHGLRFPAPAPYLGVAEAPQMSPPSTAPTRALALSSVPCDVGESTVRRDLEVFGDVRGVEMERVLEGVVKVHFYDLRHAQIALKEIRKQHKQQHAWISGHLLRLPFTDFTAPELLVWGSPPPPARGLISGRAVWAQFVVPAISAVSEGCNQGTLVVFNLDPTISSITLKQIFQAYGRVKELRETPYKKHQRFVEFYDVRDASKALKEMNGKEINGKQVVIEFSRPGGHKNKFFKCIHPPPPPPPLYHLPPIKNNLSLHSLISTKKKKPMISSSKNGNPNNYGVAVSMCLLSLEGEREGKVETNGGQSRSVYNSGGGGGSSSSKSQKSKHTKKMDSGFLLISEEAMEDSSSCSDPRTTLMIKNIPNKYRVNGCSQKLLLNMLDNHCIICNEQIAAQDDDESQPLSSYDFLYLPVDFNNKCNVGYGFVNMTSPEAARRLYKAFHLQHWQVFNSRKICQVSYARFQGLEALKEHFKSSKFPYETEHYLPVVFSPPRDGKQLTEPVPIIIINGCKDNDHHLDDQYDLDQSDGADHYSTCGSCPGIDQENENPPFGSGGSCSIIRSNLDGGESNVDGGTIDC